MKQKMPAPRNPYVAAAKFKKAGAHVKSEKAKRRAAKMDLQGSRKKAVDRWGNERFDESNPSLSIR